MIMLRGVVLVHPLLSVSEIRYVPSARGLNLYFPFESLVVWPIGIHCDCVWVLLVSS